jgi:hypothetical protein
MTTTPIARMIDRIRYNCPGALDGVVRLELYNAMSEFFQRTNIWLFEVPIEIVPTTNDYVVDTGQNVVVNRLMATARVEPYPGVSLDYAPTDPPQFLIDNNPSTGSQINNPIFRTPREAVLLNAGTPNPVIRIMINPGPNQLWVATLALNIVDPLDADGLPVVPQSIMEKYKDHISAGAISRMMAQGGKPYSNDPGAAYHGRRFNQGVGLARQEVRDMFTYGGQRWVFPRGWARIKSRFNW